MDLARLGPYVVLRRIGRGAVGEIWYAHDERTRRDVAIKVLAAELAGREAFFADFRNEVRAVANLDHPNVVRIYDQGQVEEPGLLVAGSPWLAMELADAALAERPPADFRAVRHVLGSVLRGLAHAHARGWLHRDLKPSNVLRVGARVVLADFGLGHLVHRAIDRPSAVSGTPRFMAPEQHLGRWRDFGPWTDLYALGCIAWRLTAGRHLFPGSDAAVLRRAHLTAPLPAFVPAMAVPAGFEDWLARLVARRIGDRFAFAADALHALEALGDAGPGIAASIDRAEPAVRTPSRRTASALSSSVAEPTLDLDAASDEVEDPDALDAPRTPIVAPFPTVPGEPPASASDRSITLYAERLPGLVGRRAERTVLWEALRSVARDRRSAAVLVEGAAGLGKSHLVRWMTERALETGAALVVEAVHERIPSGRTGIAAALARFFGAFDLPTEEAARQLSRWAADRLGPIDVADVEALADTLPGGPPIDRRNRHATLLGWLRRIALHRPLLLVLDDAQWTADGCVFARRVIEEEQLPVLIVLTVQREALADRPLETAVLDGLRATSRVTVLSLGALDPDTTVALVRDRLGLEPRLASQVVVRSGGSPMLAVQLVRDCVERGLLVEGPDGLALRDGAAPELPQDVREVWRRRLDRVLAGSGADERRAIRAAAALGTEVGARDWAEVCTELGIAPAAGLLDALLDRRLAIAGPDGPARGWSFAHALLREVVLEGEEPESLHAACARIAARSGGPLADERVGRHLLAGGRPEEALPHLLEAARHRWRTGDFAVVDALLGEWSAAARGLAGSDPRRAPGLVLMAGAARIQHRLEEAHRLAADALAEARAHRWADAEVAALAEVATVELARGRSSDGLARLDEARQCAERLGDPGRVAMIRADLGDALNERGRPVEAAICFRENLAYHESTGDLWEQAHALFGLGFAAIELGDLDAAETHLHRCLEVLAPTGAALGLAKARTLLGRVAELRGDLASAAQWLADSSRVLSRAGGEPTEVLRLGVVRLRTGDLPDAIAPIVDGEPREAWCTCTHAWLLACVAGSGRWDRWPAVLATLRRRADTDDLVWSELPRAAEIASEFASRAGEEVRAEEARALARRWREALRQA